jgi:hypothetical protein
MVYWAVSFSTPESQWEHTTYIQAIPKKVNLTIDFYKVKTVFPWKTAIKAKFLWGHIS